MPWSPVLDRLRKSARANPRRIVLPEVDDERICQAREHLLRDRLVEVVWVEQPATDTRLEEVVSHIHQRRQSSGVDAAEAREMALNPLYFAASLVALGHADAGVAGAANPTAKVTGSGRMARSITAPATRKGTKRPRRFLIRIGLRTHRS